MTMSIKLWVLAILVLLCSTAMGFEKPIANDQWNDTVKVWAARSCIGEAGFNRPDECTAILWVLAKRAKQTGIPFLTMIKNYSRPVKHRVNHPKPWLFHLDLGMQDKPKHWNQNLKWAKYKAYWESTLIVIQEWSEGMIPDQFPTANEFGGHGDTHRAVSMGMKKVGTMYGNIFWRSKGAL